MTLNNLVKDYNNTQSKLKQEVLSYLISRYVDYDDIATCINEILAHGCQSGCVSDLIYYSQTLPFYERHKNEIIALLYEEMDDFGEYDIMSFIHEWDEKDPLGLNTHNKNLLAWFGFETTLYYWALQYDLVN